MKTINTRLGGTFSGGVQYTEAEREEYRKKWEAFGQHFAKTKQGGRKRVRGRIVQVRGPVTKDDRWNPGGTKSVYELRLEFRRPGMEGLNHTEDVTDSLDPRAKLYAAYTAVVGEDPEGDSHGNFAWNPGVLTTRDVEFVVQRQKDRNDGKRGGFFFNIVGFDPIESELEREADPIGPDAWVEVEQPMAAAVRSGGSAAMPSADLFDTGDEDEDDDPPFDDGDDDEA